MNRSFYDKLCALRLTGMILYDKGRAQGHGHEQLAEDLKPLKDQVDSIYTEGVEKDLAGVVCAMKFLENEAVAQERDARFLLEKAKDTRQHIKNLHDKIQVHLEANGLEQRLDRGFGVTLVNGHVTIR